MGCGMSVNRHHYASVDDLEHHSTPLQSMKSRCCGRRQGPPCARFRSGCSRRPPWAKQVPGTEGQDIKAASPALSQGFASPASISEGFRKSLYEDEKKEGLAASFRDEVEESGPPRYSKVMRE